MSYQSVNEFLSYSICSGSFSMVPTQVIQTYLDEAQEEINTALVMHHTLPLPSGSSYPAYPNIVLECERVICAYRLIINQGLEPGTGYEFLERRYKEVVGEPINPQSGILGQWAYGHRALLVNNIQATTQKPQFGVFGQPLRPWQQGQPVWNSVPGNYGKKVF